MADWISKISELAREEAERFNHEYIGTEHLLLALFAAGCSGAGNVLKKLKVDATKTRIQIERIVSVGPEMVTMGHLPRTPRAQRVFVYAREEAAFSNSKAVGSEHLLLGLLRDEETCAYQVLLNVGLKPSEAREQIAASLSQCPDPRWLHWNDATIPKIARAIRKEERWENLPILADALEDAGCTDTEILGHLRQQEMHSAGCWVIDRLLSDDEPSAAPPVPRHRWWQIWRP